MLNLPLLRSICVFCVFCGSSFPAAPDQPLSRILFGSCIKQEKPVPTFKAILQRKPEAFLFIGDNIYGDTEDMEVMTAKYDALAAIEGFSQLRTTCPLFATWDDHDYGVNDGGADYPMREQSKEVFLNFWNTPANSPLHTHEGIYDSALLGPERQRLIDLIKTTNAKGILFLSGDRHWADLSLLSKEDGAPYPLYDLTSSGLNQIHPRGTPTDNRFRTTKQTYHQENFGEIQINWNSSPVQLHLSIRDLKGTPQIQKTLSLDALAPQ